MSISNTYKSLIFTTLLTTMVVFLGFTIHIKKKAALVAETYYELNDEAIEEDEELTEELNDILKSLDNLLSPSTNQAYNETKDYENQDLNDPEFDAQIEAIKNRTTIDDLKANTDPNSVASPSANTEASTVFNEINSIVDKRSENQKQTANTSANKNSSISYSLIDRTHTFLPTPVYLCDQGGKIIINITVNQLGNVIKVKYNNTSPSTNGCLIDHALKYAKAAKFNNDASKMSQIGSITFHFKDKP